MKERQFTIMKTGTKKLLATIVTLIIVLGWTVAIKGVGPIKSISKQMKYGLDINGGVYVLLQADTKAKGSDLAKLMDQTKNSINIIFFNQSNYIINSFSIWSKTCTVDTS